MKKNLSAIAIALCLFSFSIESIQANDRFPLQTSTQTMLTETEISQKLTNLPEWKIEERQLRRTFKLKNFVESIAFVDSLVEPAEKLAHHPDLIISYNRVTVILTTHDAGGLTQKDFDLAKIVSDIFTSSIRSNL
jgi:4a-hydroxytetrahydrobiopterin dehydratase